MKLNETDILVSLRTYFKENKMTYWLNGNIIEPRNVRLIAPTLPWCEGDYGDELNYSLCGVCTLDCGFRAGWEMSFNCIACVGVENNNVIVKIVKDNRVDLKLIRK